MKKCKTCGLILPFDMFHKHKISADGLRSNCKSCRSINEAHYYTDKREHRILCAKQRRQLPEVKEKQNYYSKQYAKNNKLKLRARAILNYNVRTGKLSRPTNCQDCGSPNQIEGHHEDYSKPLDVKWLCVFCHKRIDNGNHKRSNANKS